jgi:hypothetical protein
LEEVRGRGKNASYLTRLIIDKPGRDRAINLVVEGGMYMDGLCNE